MKNTVKSVIVLALLATLLLACNSTPESEQTIVATATPEQSEEELVETADEPTPESSETPNPTATSEPTATPTTEPTVTPEPTATLEPTATPEPTKIPELGEVATAFGYSLSALKVEDPASKPGIFYEPEDGKKLIGVEFIVGNISGETVSTNVLYATLVDSEGFAYGAESGAVEDSITLLDITPGERVSGWAGFIIPEEANPASLKYAINGSSDEVLQVSLSEPEDTQDNEPQPTHTPMPDLARLGDVVENYGYTLSAVTVEDPATNPGVFYEQTEGEKLVGVEFIVGNSSGETFSSNVLYAALVDTRGFVYEAESGAVNNSIELLDVNQGEKVRGWAGFIIPEDATPAYFKYAISGSEDTTLVVGLNQ